MANVTQVVCDGCGRGETSNGGTVEQLSLEFTGERPLSIQADVHNRSRCIIAAIKTQVTKHFNEPV